MDRLYTHKAVLEYLMDLNAKSKLSNQYIFSGIRGIGKKKVATELAKIILNTKRFATHPDFMILERDKTIKVDDIGECNKFLSEKPITANKKVLIIDNAELMNRHSANKFLKTFEETPDYTHVFLITSKKNELIDTIVSRAVTIDFPKNSYDDIRTFLSSSYESDYAKEIASISGGSIGYALEIINDEKLYDVINMPFDIFGYIIKGKKLSLIDLSSKIENDYAMKLINHLLYFFRDLFIVKLNKNIDLLYYSNRKDELEDYSILIKKDKLEDVITAIDNAKRQIKANCSKKTVIFAMLLNIYEELK